MAVAIIHETFGDELKMESSGVTVNLNSPDDNIFDLFKHIIGGFPNSELIVTAAKPKEDKTEEEVPVYRGNINKARYELVRSCAFDFGL